MVRCLLLTWLMLGAFCPALAQSNEEWKRRYIASYVQRFPLYQVEGMVVDRLVQFRLSSENWQLLTENGPEILAHLSGALMEIAREEGYDLARVGNLDQDPAHNAAFTAMLDEVSTRLGVQIVADFKPVPAMHNNILGALDCCWVPLRSFASPKPGNPKMFFTVLVDPQAKQPRIAMDQARTQCKLTIPVLQVPSSSDVDGALKRFKLPEGAPASPLSSGPAVGGEQRLKELCELVRQDGYAWQAQVLERFFQLELPESLWQSLLQPGQRMQREGLLQLAQGLNQAAKRAEWGGHEQMEAWTGKVSCHLVIRGQARLEQYQNGLGNLGGFGTVVGQSMQPRGGRLALDLVLDAKAQKAQSSRSQDGTQCFLLPLDFLSQDWVLNVFLKP